MSSVNIARNMKDIHPDSMLLFRHGSFYHAYGKDAVILSYFFDYRIKTVERNVMDSGFPKGTENKVLARLDKENVNYILLDTKNDYDIIDEADFQDLNKYEIVYEKAKRVVNAKRRIYAIENYLLEEVNNKNINKILAEIENIIYEA